MTAGSSANRDFNFRRRKYRTFSAEPLHLESWKSQSFVRRSCKHDYGRRMTTSENPYSIPASQQRFDPMTVYQESFFALIWPSVVWTVFMLGLMLLADLVVPQLAGGRSFAIDLSPWATLLTLLITPLSAYFFTGRRLVRSDGQQRSIRRSLLNAVGIMICAFGASIASVTLANIVRELVGDINSVKRTIINATVIPLVHSLLLSILFKFCWREIQLPRFALVSLGMTVLIMLSVFSHPSIPELTKPIFLTFFHSLVALIAHCTCFAWWYATPKLSGNENSPAMGIGQNRRQVSLLNTPE